MKDRLTDNQGRTVDFKNTIIIMTSNLGSHLIQEKLSEINEDNFENIIGELRGTLGSSFAVDYPTRILKSH